MDQPRPSTRPAHEASKEDLLQRTKSRAEFVVGAAKLNQHGGVWISPKEIEYAAKFYGDGEKITINGLKKRLLDLKIPIDHESVKELFGDRHEISVSDLRELLDDNSITDYDPVYDAFRTVCTIRDLI